MQPDVIVETDIDARTDGQLTVPEGHTCTGTGGVKTYDYGL